MTTHELKSWPQTFWDVATRKKTFELRRRDRNFAVGDTLHLREWDPTTQVYSGRETFKRITFILAGGQFGVDPAYCVLGIDDEYLSEAPGSNQPAWDEFIRYVRDAQKRLQDKWAPVALVAVQAETGPDHATQLRLWDDAAILWPAEFPVDERGPLLVRIAKPYKDGTVLRTERRQV